MPSTIYHSTNQRLGHRCVTFEQSGQILGFAYYAPAAMTDRTWYLYWIAVTRQTQARGIGGKLLKHVEQDIQQANGRVLFIETSGIAKPNYDLTQQILRQARLRTRRHFLLAGYWRRSATT